MHPILHLRVRRSLFTGMLLVLLAGCQPPAAESGALPAASQKPMTADSTQPDLRHVTAVQLRQQLASGERTALEVTRSYLQRIAEIDDSGPRLNAVIEINPDALAIAQSLDDEFSRTGPVGPLHGLPVLLKANIDTADAMATSAGSLALADHHAQTDAFLVTRLREAGAVIIGKTNLSEWANFRDNGSSSGWSSLGGQTRNPHVLDRNPCGSSSGSAAAVAAALAPLSVGTETNGSISCPAGVNGIVGIKPTLGSVSRSGIIPIAHSQDTAGPMARTVTDAALLLQVMVAHDPADPGARTYPRQTDLMPDPLAHSLAGKRIGIYRSYYGAGKFPRVEQIYTASIEALAALGATLIDPIRYQPAKNEAAAQYDLLLFEFKADLNAYLDAHQLPDPVASLAQLINWNEAHADKVMPVFGQSIFIDAQAKPGLDDPAYIAAREASVEHMRMAMEAMFAENELDALFIPVNGPAWKTDWIGGDNYSFGGTSSLAAVSGYPSVIVPAGDVSGLPIAVGFVGAPFSEKALIQMAFEFEQATGARIEPEFLPSIESDQGNSD